MPTVTRFGQFFKQCQRGALSRLTLRSSVGAMASILATSVASNEDSSSHPQGRGTP